MVIERNTFYLKFGKAKEAIAIWKEILEGSKNTGMKTPEMRLLSDMSGESYTLVVELYIKDMIDLNQKQAVWGTTEKFQTLYQKFIPLCERAQREFFKIEDEI